MTDKQVNKWLRRRFSGIGWVLISYYLLMNALVLLDMLLAEVRGMLGMVSGKTVDPAAYLDSAWGYVVTVLVGIAVLHVWKGPDYWRQEVLVRSSRMRPGVFLALLLLAMGAQMVNSLWIMALELVLNLFGLSAMGVLESVSGASDTFSMFLYASILAPISEEILFRGYVLRSLKPFGKRFAIWGSAILFGLFHGNLLQTPYAILMGVLFGYVTVEYSIVWAVGLHLFNNLVLADLLTRLTASWSDMAYGALNLVLFGGSFLAALVILIRNRERIRAYRESEGMDPRVWKWFFLNGGVLVLAVIALVNMAALLFL